MASRFHSRKLETTFTNKQNSTRPKYTAANAKERAKEKQRRKRERRKARKTEKRDHGSLANVRTVAANQEQPTVQEVISSRKRRRIANDDTLRTVPPDALTIYTDGACVDNGKAGARAGYSVFFMDNDCRNRSARVLGKQTNQRGELFAVLKALDRVGVGQAKCQADWLDRHKTKTERDRARSVLGPRLVFRVSSQNPSRSRSSRPFISVGPQAMIF
jgi:hypothetical protein